VEEAPAWPRTMLLAVFLHVICETSDYLLDTVLELVCCAATFRLSTPALIAVPRRLRGAKLRQSLCPRSGLARLNLPGGAVYRVSTSARRRYCLHLIRPVRFNMFAPAHHQATRSAWPARPSWGAHISTSRPLTNSGRRPPPADMVVSEPRFQRRIARDACRSSRRQRDLVVSTEDGLDVDLLRWRRLKSFEVTSIESPNNSFHPQRFGV